MSFLPVVKFSKDHEVSRLVKIWLIAGLLMIFLQIVIGGVTRLTGSGLSITRWEIVTGVWPPVVEKDWEKAFDLYKETPQYSRINRGMAMDDFKFIYFWEYFHRLWARLMFVVFIIPFFVFLFNGHLTRRIYPRMLLLVCLAGIEGFFGWIMVASGLIERPWVNAYNLTLHLTMALFIFSYLFWTTLLAFFPGRESASEKSLLKIGNSILVLVFIQLALGAMMSGTKAGLIYPTWPKIGNDFLPGVLLSFESWKLIKFTAYDSDIFLPSLLHVLHRNSAYLLAVLIGLWFYKSYKFRFEEGVRGGFKLLVIIVFIQMCLGIITVMTCVGSVPVLWGVLHQAGAVALLSIVLWVRHSVEFRMKLH
jgi:cytochrome c oxidase assembly protein subunit 15